MRLQRAIAGIVLALIALAFLVVTHFWVIAPAMTQRNAEGNYGEMHGPVIALRWYFYGASAVVIGVLLACAWYLIRAHRRERARSA